MMPPGPPSLAPARPLLPANGERVLLPGQSPDGEYVLSVLVKRSYRIVPGGTCTRLEVDREILGGDVFWDHPMNSSVRFETDFWPFKVATDVVLNGTAYAPGGEPTNRCEVSLQVDDRRKSIVVLGDRLAEHVEGKPPVFTDPEPFTRMPIRYEYAYGGTDVFSDVKIPYPYPRNPLGRGFVVANSARSLADVRLPNLEDPATPVTEDTLCLGNYAHWETCPLPAGFGWFPKVWRPRALLAGVLPRDRAIEQELRRVYAELITDREQREAYLKHGFPDMDFRFFNGASQGQVFPFLEGGETIATENLTPDGTLAFQLPTERPRIGLDIGDGMEEPEVVLHTVMIHLDEGEIDLVWRGAVPYPGPEWLPEMKKTEIVVE